MAAEFGEITLPELGRQMRDFKIDVKAELSAIRSELTSTRFVSHELYDERMRALDKEREADRKVIGELENSLKRAYQMLIGSFLLPILVVVVSRMLFK